MPLYQMVLKKLKTTAFLKGFQILREGRGAVFVMTAMLVPLLLGMLGFAYDAGNLYMHKGRLQHVADAASLAGARAFVEGETEKSNEFKNSGVAVGTAEKKEIRNHAKSTAKSAAVRYGDLDMANLGNRDYTGVYSLVEDKSHQQYFRVEMTEKVPLYFIKILTNNSVQDVKAAANSTIPKLTVGNTNNHAKPVTVNAHSLFMVKSGFTVEGTGFYNSDSTPQAQKDSMHPTWEGSFDGDLYFTGNSVSYNLGSNQDAYDNTPFTKAFNSKAKALLGTVKPLKDLAGKNEQEIAANELFLNFVDKLKQNPDYYANDAFTDAGNEFINTMKSKLSQADGGYPKAYNYFYEKLRDTPFYYSTFTHIDYDMDSFGNAVKNLFQQKLANTINIAGDNIPEYVEDKAKWNAAINSITEEQVNAAYDAALANYQAIVNTTPNDLYNLLLPYHRVDQWNNLLNEAWEDYVAAGRPVGLTENDKYILGGGWSTEGQGVTQKVIDWSPGTWQWQRIKGCFLGNSSAAPSKDGIRESLLRQATGGLTHEPVPDEYKPAAGDTYYAQYNGSKHSWTASEVSNNLNSREHSYFCYQGSFTTTLDFTIDEAGFYTDETIGTDDPFYLFVAANIEDKIGIQLNVDMNRPLVFCYMGTNNPKIHIELNGHTFRGVIYTPNSHQTEISDSHMNLSGGTFKGTWMSDSIYLKQANTQVEYVEYDLEDSLETSWPTIQTEESVDPGEPDDPVDNQNQIKVVKLVNNLKDVILIEQIE